MPENDTIPRRSLTGDFPPNPKAVYVELGVASAFSVAWSFSQVRGCR